MTPPVGSSSSGGGALRPGTPVRRLPNVLRQGLSDRNVVRFAVGEVLSIPDPAHVTVQIADPTEDADPVPITVPRLSTYNPNVGEPAYLLVSSQWTLALGTVKEV